MLTNFFGKSNPINFLALSLFILFGFAGYGLSSPPQNATFGFIVNYSINFLICIFSMLLVDFIIRKNALTRTNTFGIFFFSCFLLMFPKILLDVEILVSNLIILLALRRILSLKSERNLEKKILDASLWISLASLIYIYSILYFVILFVSVIRKKHTTYKHILIPVIGFFGVFICYTSYHLIANGSFDWYYRIDWSIGKDFSVYNSLEIVIPISLFLSLLVWAGLHRLYKLPTVPKKWRPNYLLIVLIVMVSLFVALASPEKNSAELLFIIAPAAIMVANYMEEKGSVFQKRIENIWFKEILLWLVIVLPIILMISK